MDIFIELDGACGRLYLLKDEGKKRGLARAVRADKPDLLSGVEP